MSSITSCVSFAKTSLQDTIEDTIVSTPVHAAAVFSAPMQNDLCQTGPSMQCNSMYCNNHLHDVHFASIEL